MVNFNEMKQENINNSRHNLQTWNTEYKTTMCQSGTLSTRPRSNDERHRF